ncbi:response regulator [Geothrix sp.]|jgi:DNA repair exonuclease SbcCD ATPase subunit|uniref:response regulator n=1 Tax=Geothrix sp. TaxID=1962974 RepID=UPI0025B863FE|nr:response regulator [Geothrix sp.]
MGQRLLLVDSDRSFLKEHQVSLEAAFDLEVAASPEGVVPRLERGDFAAVLICVEVADNKGYALCSSLRKNAALEGLKVALISAKATEEEYRRHQSLKGKADLYLHKPIAPSALVAALTPLVPGRVLDPDNPLGELVDTELGDDWLDGLRNALDGPAAAAEPAAFAPSAGPATVPTPGLATAVQDAPRDNARIHQLETEVAALREELRTKDQRLRQTEGELQQHLGSVTLNLDEAARRDREAEGLKARLAEAETALRQLQETQVREGEGAESLKAQLKEALGERADLIAQVEALNQQVGDKAQRAIELLKERDRLLHENLDLEPFRAKAQELAQELEAARLSHGEALAAKDEALAGKQQALEAALEAQGQLNATLEGLVGQHATLEGVHQAALLEVAGYKEKAHVLQLEVAGLEATMRGQGRDLAELSTRLRQVEEELATSQAQLQEREQQLAVSREEAAQLGDQVAEFRQRLDEATIQHDGERLELMNGLDQKEAQLSRMAQALADQQDAHSALVQEKQAVHGQLSEHRERLQSLDALLQEVQERLRRGSDLAKG